MATVTIPGYVLLDLKILLSQVTQWRGKGVFKVEKPQVKLKEWIDKNVAPYVTLTPDDKATINPTFISADQWDQNFVTVRSVLLGIIPTAIPALDSWYKSAKAKFTGKY